jgi:hypothetical protein
VVLLEHRRHPGLGTHEIAGPWRAYGTPAITADAAATEVAYIGADASLCFDWIINGTTTWHAEQVAGPGNMQGTPAMVSGNYTMEIAVTATDGSLRYYWSHDGTPTWYQGQIAPPGYANTSPSGGGTEIAVAGP